MTLPSPAPSSPQDVLVVGSGIAGLTVAHLLSSEHRVTIIERASTLGMDQSSVSFAGGRIDVPLRTFNLDYYPNLASLYSELGVVFGVADYSFCCFDRNESSAYFRFYNRIDHALGYLTGTNKVSLPVLRLSTLRYAFEFVVFMWKAHRDLHAGTCHGQTFREYCSPRYSEDFYWKILMPMLSVVCTCTFDSVGRYPAEIIVDYLTGPRGSLLSNSTQRATSGTADVVSRFSRQCAEILLGCTVKEIVPKSSPGDKAMVRWVDAQDQAHAGEFDQVIVATQANSALDSLKAHCSPQLARTLASIQYERNTTVLHCDGSILPRTSDDWSSANLGLASDWSASDCTIWMNRVDKQMAQLTQDVYQTWNPICPIADSKIVAHFEFERPVLTLNSEAALAELQRLNGQQGLWFVGAYTLYTMPLLESGVRSAIRVANRLTQTQREEKGGLLHPRGSGLGLWAMLSLVGVGVMVALSVTKKSGK